MSDPTPGTPPNGGRGFTPGDMARRKPVSQPQARSGRWNGASSASPPNRGSGGAGRTAPSGQPEMPVRCVGPLGSLLQVSWGLDGKSEPALVGVGATADANALVVLRRTAFVPDGTGEVELPPQAAAALRLWAEKNDLGQVRAQVAAAALRRDRALEQFVAQGKHVKRVLLTPEWRTVVGLGERANAHEVGIALHGTYGWPIIPGSGLKGAAAAHALAGVEEATVTPADFVRVFGAAPSSEPHNPVRNDGAGTVRPSARGGPGTAGVRGGVRFLDAFAAGAPVDVSADTLTPHVKPYYDSTGPADANGRALPPAEHHQPVPVGFLTVSGGTFAAAVVGDDPDATDLAAQWLDAAAKDQGLGAKTTAGYGYMTTPQETPCPPHAGARAR